MLYNNINQIHIWHLNYKIPVFNCPIYHDMIYAVTLEMKQNTFTSIIWKKYIIENIEILNNINS